MLNPHEGTIRYIVFRDGDAWYAAALELNIVETGTTPQEAWLLLFDAMVGAVEAAVTSDVCEALLHQTPDAEYEEMWLQARSGNNGPNMFTFGEVPVPSLKRPDIALA